MALPSDINALCNRLANVTYENLSKILCYARTGSAERAQMLDDSHQNDLDHWMGGGTCFSITWHLYQELQGMGYQPRLVMGHKRKVRNIHCGLCCEDHFFDPGYLIFDPLLLPPPGQSQLFPLRPNVVELHRPHVDELELWTGSLAQPLKLRFEFPLLGVDELEFQTHWRASFHAEMMQYPVLNRLDRELGVQYYFQKGNLIVRDSSGSRIQAIPELEQVRVLSETFRLDPQLVSDALGSLRFREK